MEKTRNIVTGFFMKASNNGDCPSIHRPEQALRSARVADAPKKASLRDFIVKKGINIVFRVIGI